MAKEHRPRGRSGQLRQRHGHVRPRPRHARARPGVVERLLGRAADRGERRLPRAEHVRRDQRLVHGRRGRRRRSAPDDGGPERDPAEAVPG